MLNTKQTTITLPLKRDNEDSGGITLTGEAVLINSYRNPYLNFYYLVEDNGAIRFKDVSFFDFDITKTVDQILAFDFDYRTKSYNKVYLYDNETVLDWSTPDDAIVKGLKIRYSQDPSTLGNPLHTSCQREKDLISPLFWEVYNKFDNEEQFAKVAKIAADWWAGELYKSGSSGDAGIDLFYNYTKSQTELPELDEQTITKFKNALAEIILAKLIEKKHPDFFSSFIVATDYDPDYSLATALEAAGIEQSSFNLPMKTVSWIYPTCFKINRKRDNIVFKEELFDG